MVETWPACSVARACDQCLSTMCCVVLKPGDTSQLSHNGQSVIEMKSELPGSICSLAHLFSNDTFSCRAFHTDGGRQAQAGRSLDESHGPCSGCQLVWHGSKLRLALLRTADVWMQCCLGSNDSELENVTVSTYQCCLNPQYCGLTSAPSKLRGRGGRRGRRRASQLSDIRH